MEQTPPLPDPATRTRKTRKHGTPKHGTRNKPKTLRMYNPGDIDKCTPLDVVVQCQVEVHRTLEWLGTVTEVNLHLILYSFVP